MKFVDFAVDLAAVLNASRSVARRHAALRARQLETYGKTSRSATKPKPEQSEETTSEAGSRETAGDNVALEGESDENVAAPENLGRAGGSDAIHIPHVLPASGSEQLRGQGRLGGGTSAVLKSLKEETGSVFPASQNPISGIKQRPSPTTSQREPLPGSPTQLDHTEYDGDIIPKDVNINIFRTSRGSRILQGRQETGNVASRHPLAPGEADVAGLPSLTLDDVAASETLVRPETVASEEQPSLEGKLSLEGKPETAEVLPVSPKPYMLRESTVPSSRLSRLWNYGGLAAGMLGGAISESISRAAGGSGQGSVLLSGKNMERLVAKLSRMRGAALKLGQMMSFQDSKMLPGPIQEVLQRVQDRADYMPSWQRDRVLESNLGQEWRNLFEDFEEKPIAAASIGQVHVATLKSSGKKVAVKIQFPGVADSINSDLDNLGVLLTATKLLPKGLYLNKTITNARTELGWECDYVREAECARRYQDLLSHEADVFVVPDVHPEVSGKQVLTMDYMEGIGVTRISSFTQEQKDWIGTQILRLCLREITEFRFMQTDPNWTNFLYNAKTSKLELLDFGASREYPDAFVTQYVQLLEAASRSDRDAVKELSQRLGYLTGHESRAMLDAHIDSVTTLAEPFLASAPEVYDFQDQTITERVKALIPVMLRERLAPPPEETYSLHRKLSGAFLLCARLGSRVRCREMFETSWAKSGIKPFHS